MLIIKGLIIGIGKIIPGVSGSILAISLGEYERMLYAVNNYFKDVVANSKYLVKICIGIAISIILFSNIIAKSINSYYIYTMFLFAGFILGSNSEIKKGININIIDVIVAFIIFLSINKFILNDSLILNKSFIYYVFGGFLDSVTMIIPGISGTSLLIAYGCYNEVINSIAAINVNILLPFIIGMIIGVILMVKVISYMFKSFKDKTYSLIMGISMATIVIMLKKGIDSNSGLTSILISSMLFAIGYILSKKMITILVIK